MTPELFSRMRRSLAAALIEVLLRLFRELGAWRSSDATVFARHAVPLVQGSQQTLAGLVATYMAEQASIALGRVVAPPTIPDTEVWNLRAGVEPEDVYLRPFTTVYTALASGRPLPEAVELGASRVAEIAEADLQQTYARSSRAAMRALPSEARPRFWRRALVGEENCAMCVVASTQRYRVETLNPIHPGCDCRVEPIFGRDPGQVIDESLLERVHEAVEALTGEADRGARAPDYRQLTTRMTREHGELGPMLVRPRDKFTGPRDLS